MATKNVFQQIALLSKGVAVALILVGIPTFILDGSPNSEMPLMSGLFILFITTVKGATYSLGYN